MIASGVPRIPPNPPDAPDGPTPVLPLPPVLTPPEGPEGPEGLEGPVPVENLDAVFVRINKSLPESTLHDCGKVAWMLLTTVGLEELQIVVISLVMPPSVM